MMGLGQGWGKPAGVCLEKEATRGGRQTLRWDGGRVEGVWTGVREG